MNRNIDYTRQKGLESPNVPDTAVVIGRGSLRPLAR
jgi:hypothetical protein